MIQEKELKVGNQYILYDSAMRDVKLTSWPYLFDVYFLEQHQLVTARVQGRGTTYFFDWESHKLVLRHYWRGGWVSTFNSEFYLKTKLEKMRPYQEWQLLCELQKLGLPVPKPAGMRIVSGGLFYCADLLMHQIEGVTPLCDLLQQGELSLWHWHKIGQVIRQFHNEAVYHNDLNCHNILLRDEEVFLIDFDKSFINKNGQDIWKNKNLDRLLRSLNKEQRLVKEAEKSFYFTESVWTELLQAYWG